MAVDSKISGQSMLDSLVNFSDQSLVTQKTNDWSEKFTRELAQTISFESALMGFMMLFKQHHNEIIITDSKLKVKASHTNLLERLNYLMEILCNVSFSFEYDAQSDEFFFDFEHLGKEIQLIMNAKF